MKHERDQTKLREGNVFTPVCDSVRGGGSVKGGLCPGGVSGGLCQGVSVRGVSVRGVSVRGVYVQWGLSLGGSLSRGSLSSGSLSWGEGGGFCPGSSVWGLCPEGGLCPGVSVEGGLCPEGSLCLEGLCQGGPPAESTPYGKEWAVLILLECILVHLLLAILGSGYPLAEGSQTLRGTILYIL